EVPPPSNFNRRVTPELDTIVFKALARDVADRYQTAAALAADLDALIAGYRFDPKELRQFMRQLFRQEYTKELQETTTALHPPPPGERARPETPPDVNPATRDSVVEVPSRSSIPPPRAPTIPPEVASPPTVPRPPVATPPTTAAPT